jgi:helicase
MKIATLEAYGLDEAVLKLWKDAGREQLLPVQEQAIRSGRVLEGKNVVVFSPTSSGKTFVGEMAAIRMARQKKRVVYLVPQKSLAEEKYREFQRQYAPLGVRVVISTRDHKEFDTDIRRGLFHVAIVVFEKMQGLLVVSPGLLSGVGLVVIDELQMIGDKNRGADLEILLTKIKTSAGKAQIIGLSAVLGNSRRLAQWLGAELCRFEHRPVELRKGVLCEGTFQYVEHNSSKTGQEIFMPPESVTGPFDVLVHQARWFAEKGEQCLVFCKSKQECVKTAQCIAENLHTPRADKALKELNLLEDSRSKEFLSQLLEHGVAFHNADLDWDQRDIVERWFRRGEIKVICATTTLAMGLNLPAKNVFIDPERWEQDCCGNWGTVSLSQSEYENISGRAGRLGLESEFGRAIIVTDSPFDSRTFFDVFAKGQLGEIEPALGRDSLAQHALNLVASRLCRTSAQIRNLLLSSYTGELLWRGGEREVEFDRELTAGIKRCFQGRLLEVKDGRLLATELGRLAAVKGLSVDTAVLMANFAGQNKAIASDLHLLEILLCLNKTEDGEAVHFNLSTAEYQSGKYLDLLRKTVQSLPAGIRRRWNCVTTLVTMNYERTKRVKKTLILYEWVIGLPTREIETRHLCMAGSISGLASEFSWLAEAFCATAKLCGWPDEKVQELRAVSERLVFGVAEGGVEIAAARVKGLGRGRTSLLVQNGWETLEKIIAAPHGKLEALLSKPLAKRLRQKAAWLVARKELLATQGGLSPEAPELPPAEPEVANWPEMFPAADELGTEYHSDAKIHLDGRCGKKRHLVKIDELEVWLSEQSFETLLKLAAAAKTACSGWMGHDCIGSPDHYHQVLRRLKRNLQRDGVKDDNLIENNLAKQYRLSVPPGNITMNLATIRHHFGHCKALKELESLENSVETQK